MPKSKKDKAEKLQADVVDLGILENPWDNVYWFSRFLINSDKYGGVGAETETMLKLASGLEVLIDKLKGKTDEESIVQSASEFIRNTLLERWGSTKRRKQVLNLCQDIGKRLNSIIDIEVFRLSCEKILVPINEALKVIPNDDRIFAESMATALMKTKGESGLSEIINLWDDLGVQGCLSAERSQVVKKFGNLRESLDTKMKPKEIDIILTAFCQEFERRVGQKRKGRAGRGVESVTSFILNFYKIKATHAPEHFTTGLEVDRWIKCRDGWFIGISCKRTLRERWKQAYTTDLGLLDRHRIKALWHLITYDRDLSDDKITEMGSHRAILYLPDNSERYLTVKAHPGMRNYIRPMTQFASDLKKET
ncbi:MAG: hypothetical protein HY755_00305 [Nitrospirae bacterium]|nr:hypothetical protein [Nitrospirota bacterium]